MTSSGPALGYKRCPEYPGWPSGLRPLALSRSERVPAVIGTVFAEALLQFGDACFKTSNDGLMPRFLLIEQPDYQGADTIQSALLKAAWRIGRNVCSSICTMHQAVMLDCTLGHMPFYPFW